MAKAIIKEIFIMLLLCVAIVLVFGVIFYDYIPTNKAVPNKLEAYVTPENIQEEIDEEIMEMNKIEVSYEITESDLDLYKQTHSYTPGKRDPFLQQVLKIQIIPEETTQVTTMVPALIQIQIQQEVSLTKRVLNNFRLYLFI